MSHPFDLVASTRRRLEEAYGLALEGLSEEQVGLAVLAALRGEAPPDPGGPEWLARVVDRLPIDESWLFRDDELWEWLQAEAGPALLERAMALGRPLRVVSLGCSAGQEPFSLALLFLGLLEATGIPPSAAGGYVSVTGIDSSPGRIAAARAGAVNAWSVQRSRRERLRDRVRLEDPASGRHRVDDAVRALCHFEVGNLLELLGRPGAAPLAGADLVLCRNVLIYFRATEAERVAAALARALDPGAILAFSAAEAHLLEPSGLVEPLGALGAGRVRKEGAPAPSARGPARRPTARPAPRRWRPPAHRAPSDAVAAHVRGAVEHAQAGRTLEALREARAALFHDPLQLFPRLLVAEQLITVDEPRGRGMLLELLAQAARLPQDSPVPLADGLSVAQLADAARLLLGTPRPP